MSSPASTLVNFPIGDNTSKTKTRDSMVYPETKPHQPPVYNATPDVTPRHSGTDGAEKEYNGEGTHESPFVVRWREDDEGSPQNWSTVRRYLITVVVAVECLVVAFGSSVYGGAVPQLKEQFGVSNELVTAGLSLYVVGFALGPLLWAPLSEMAGRRPVFVITFGLFSVTQFGCAFAHNIETLLVLRALGGFFGSAPLTNSASVVSDLFNAADRALAMSLWAIAPFLGPVLGPIVGGFIGQTVSWRWVFRVMIIFCFATWFAGILVPETYSPVLLRKRAQRLSKETGTTYVSEYDVGAEEETIVEKLKINLSRPMVLLFTEPITALFALYAAVIYGTLYGMFSAFPIVYQEGRHFSMGLAGLPFIGVGVGMIFAIFANIIVNKKYMRDMIANGGPLAPEARLPICIFGGALLPIGLFWFAWTVQPSVHWIVPCLAAVPFGCGMVAVFLATSNYIVDTYLRYAASALAANATLRSLFGAAFPLFITQMFHRLGNNWALTLLAFLSLALVPIPIIFYIYGARIRAMSSYAPGHKPVAPSTGNATAAERQRTREVVEFDIRQREENVRTMSRISALASRVSRV